jgi:hypothetical protein
LREIIVSENVPSTEPSKLNVPNTEPSKLNVPNTEPKKLKASNAEPTKPNGERVKPDQVTTIPRNRRPYVGQKLGVKHWDGSVKEIPAENLRLAIVGTSGPAGSQRVLDRSPFSGLEIVEI